MSLSEILGSAASGLAAAQAGLRSVSNNIANVSTPGYARERVSYTTGVTSGRVSGVIVGEPTRIADQFLETTAYRRAGDMGRADVVSSYLDRLQALLGQPGAEAGLPARLDAIASSATAMTGSQQAEQTAAVFTASVQDAVASMQQMEGDVTTLRADVESEVGYSVDKINTLLSRIYDLNDAVSQAQGTGKSSGGAADQRMAAIDELSGLIKVTVRSQADGRITIDSASGATLLDRKLRQLSYPTAGQGVAQPTYPVIDIRFADSAGGLGASTGETLDSAAVGGKLGGLLDLRDRALPDFADKLGTLFNGLAETLNAASNANTIVPAPKQLEGRASGLVPADRLGFTGAAIFAVTDAAGTLVAKTRLDFSAMGSGATVADAIAAINAGLGGAATASFTDGKLVIAANGTGLGVAIGQDATAPSSRAGVGFSQYFGLNDIVRSATSPLVPSGLAAGDPHGFATGQTAELVLRDASGRSLTHYTLTGSAGPTYGDLVTELNASPLGDFGDFALDDRGRIRFEAAPGVPGATLSIPSDSTDRLGTGRSFTTLSGLTGAAGGLLAGEVRPAVLASPGQLPLARLQVDAAIGEKALGAGDLRGATGFLTRLGTAVDLGSGGTVTVERYSSLLLGRTGLQASQAQDALADATARRDDAVNRRDSFAGVNIDEELSQMVVLQNSYSAAARVISTASDMYDTLLAMMN